jgi:hypothetical protein
MFRHFMSRLYNELYRSKQHGHTKLKIPERKDLALFKDFLYIASHKGISMNNLVYRKPSHILRSDSSLFGLGGYNITTAIAWRLEIPEDCRLRSSLNSLEFMASLIGIWMEHYSNSIPIESCILSQTDSTSAAGWIKKSNFAESKDQTVQLYTARKLASIIIEAESCLYSQWFQGDDNQVADSLSRDFHLNDTELTKLILTSIPEQVPFGFKIHPIPQEIYSWVTCLLHNQPSTQQWSQEPIRSKLWLGKDTLLTSTQLESTVTSTSNNSTNYKNRESWEHLQTPSERIDFILENLITTNPSFVNPPSNAWHRPTEWQDDPVQHLTQMGKLHSFYKDNSEGTQTTTNP